MNVSTHSALCLVIAGIEVILAVVFGVIVFKLAPNFKAIAITLVFLLGISGLAKLIIKAIPSKRK